MVEYIRNLSIRKKFIILIILAMAFSAVFNILVHRFILYQNYIELENRWAVKDIRRAHQAIDREIFHLDNLCRDWASWDDTYIFVKTKSRKYLESNLNNESFSIGNYNLIGIIDTDFRPVFINGIDLINFEKRIPALFTDMEGIRQNNLLAFQSNMPLQDQKRTGLIQTEHGLMMLVIRPILTSENKGPSMGFFILGRYLNATVIQTLKDQTEVNFKINYIAESRQSEMEQSIIDKLVKKKERFVLKDDKKDVIVNSLYMDIYGNPSFIISAIYPRSITEEGAKVTIVSLLLLMAGLFFIIILIWVMLSSSVINPIELLKCQIKSIVSGNYDRSNVINSQDELGLLSLVIDDMAKTITIQTDELKHVNSRLEILSITDGLTDTFNRRHFDNRIKIEWERACRSGEILSLIMCDIDYFKKYNDIYGHQAGDDCLIKVAASLKASMQRVSDEVYRYGGEEFIIILPNTTANGALYIARKILKSVSMQQIEHEGSEAYRHVTISAGTVSVIPKKGRALKDFIYNADQALYESKNRGRNRICSADHGSDGSILFSEYSVEE